MLRRTLTILSLLGLLLSVGLWGVSYYRVMFVLPSLRNKIDLSRGAVTLQSLTAPTMPDDWLRLARQSIAETTVPKGVRVGVGGRHVHTTTVNGAVTASYTYFYPGQRNAGFQSLNTLWTFSYRRIGAGSSREMIELRMPFWIPTLVLAVASYTCYPAHLQQRRKRKKLGLCVKCGYDLRASKERCPECGNEFQETCSAAR